MKNIKSKHNFIFLTIAILVIAGLWNFFVYPKLVFSVGAPTSLVAIPGDGQVLLEWRSPNAEVDDGSINIDEGGRGSEGIIGYRIYYSSEISLGDLNTIDLSNTTNYLVSGLINGTQYGFYVVALLNDNTETRKSETIYATPSHGEEIVLVGNPTVITTSTSAVITWITNILGTSVVEYGPISDLSGQFDLGKQKTNEHFVEITGLTPCAGYWFKVVSYSNESNFTESQGGEFKTRGCKGDSNVLTYEARLITLENGNTISITNSGRSITVNAPASLKSGFNTLAVEAVKLEKDLVKSEISTPTSKQWIGNAYSLKVFKDEKTIINTEFDNPVEVSITYTSEDIDGINTDTLKIYHYEDGLGWRPLSNCVHNKNEMIVTCQTKSFSVFGLFGESNPLSSEDSSPSSGGSGSYQSGYFINQNKIINNNDIQTVSNNQKNNFNKNLWIGTKDSDVKLLQKFLNTNGFVLTSFGPGSPGNETDFFGPLTKNALIRFQEKNADLILKPFGLFLGTGFFGERTRLFINSL